MRQPKPKYYTVGEFFDFVRRHEGFFELRHGEIVAMASPSMEHEDIADRIVDVLNAKLKDRCRASKNRYIATPSDTYRIPDVIVWCGEREIIKRAGSELIGNPIILFEVVSPDSDQRDYQEKLTEYKAIPSLDYYVIVEQDRPEVAVWSRHGDFWCKEEFEGFNAVIEISGLQASFKLSEIYQ